MFACAMATHEDRAVDDAMLALIRYDDASFASLFSSYQSNHARIIKLLHQQANMKRSLSVYEFRLSGFGFAGILDIGDPQSDNYVPGSPQTKSRRNINSHFTIKYPKKTRLKDMEMSKHLKTELEAIDEEVVSLQRRNDVTSAELIEFSQWVSRHMDMDMYRYCPFPFYQACEPRPLNHPMSDNSEACTPYGHSISHQLNTWFARNSNAVECLTCNQPYNRSDWAIPRVRFCKLKSENFAMRLRRSYSSAAIDVVRDFMENFVDDSTGIFHYGFSETQEFGFGVSVPHDEEDIEMYDYVSESTIMPADTLFLGSDSVPLESGERAALWVQQQLNQH